MSSPTKDDIFRFVQLLANGYGLEAGMVMKQIEAESSFRQDAVSSRQAVGLMQLEPIGVLDLKMRCGLQVDPHIWQQNVVGGMAMMGLLNHHYADYAKSLAAYNWGQGNVDHLTSEHPLDWRQRLPKEPADYLNKILGPVNVHPVDKDA